MTDEHDPNEDSPNFRKLREKANVLEQENALLRQAALRNGVRAAGFDPDDGVNKLLLEKFGTDRPADELTGDKFIEFASEYGVKPPEAVKPAERAQEPVQPSEAERALDALQQAGDAVRGATTSAEPPDIDNLIAEAEKNGEVDKSLVLKMQKLRTPA